MHMEAFTHHIIFHVLFWYSYLNIQFCDLSCLLNQRCTVDSSFKYIIITEFLFCPDPLVDIYGLLVFDRCVHVHQLFQLFHCIKSASAFSRNCVLKHCCCRILYHAYSIFMHQKGLATGTNKHLPVKTHTRDHSAFHYLSILHNSVLHLHQLFRLYVLCMNLAHSRNDYMILNVSCISCCLTSTIGFTVCEPQDCKIWRSCESPFVCRKGSKLKSNCFLIAMNMLILDG